MMSLGGKVTALVCHPTTKVNIAEELTCLSTNIVWMDKDFVKYNYFVDFFVEWHIRAVSLSSGDVIFVFAQPASPLTYIIFCLLLD